MWRRYGQKFGDLFFDSRCRPCRYSLDFKHRGRFLASFRSTTSVYFHSLFSLFSSSCLLSRGKINYLAVVTDVLFNSLLLCDFAPCDLPYTNVITACISKQLRPMTHDPRSRPKFVIQETRNLIDVSVSVSANTHLFGRQQLCSFDDR